MNNREIFHNNATKELASVYYNLYTTCINTKDIDLKKSQIVINIFTSMKI